MIPRIELAAKRSALEIMSRFLLKIIPKEKKSEKLKHPKKKGGKKIKKIRRYPAEVRHSFSHWVLMRPWIP